MHPDNESNTHGGGWNQSSSKDTLLKSFDGFSDDVKTLLEKANLDGVTVWRLLDHPTLPTWIKGRPFLPYQGQGGAQAVEDGAALGALFPPGTLTSDVEDRLKLYFECRSERATMIQEYTRAPTLKLGHSNLGHRETTNSLRFVAFNFDHDAHDFACGVLKLHFESRATFHRMPLGFGPGPGLGNDFGGGPLGIDRSITYHTTYMTFKSRKSYLQILMPTKEFRIDTGNGWATATFSITKLSNLAWLGGRGYSHFDLYVHDVVYTQHQQEKLEKRGDLLVVRFENMADPIIMCQELGFPSIFATLEAQRTDDSYNLSAGWEGTEFCGLRLDGLTAQEPGPVAVRPPIFPIEDCRGPHGAGSFRGTVHHGLTADTC
ncbi:uncharacterized protein BP5553_10606 [Venustampulla echinocandica]|uniref:Uncharacterized protein n=1 Tax=Venustampulla echinocandica TaxID=2656787 RepID=A0A370T910_9HELO|nr:uncharacterized protein BP5553_10606 [Venustampulla echinocandica]RDL29979.1 hypothetical protein BP5553_10606 [Venustampulla echinocandica]